VIKRDKRNIGRLVRYTTPNTVMTGRVGRVVGFRGDHSRDVPFVTVFIYNLGNSNGSVYTFPGHTLKLV